MRDWSVASLGSLTSFTKGRKVTTAAHADAGYLPYLGASAISGMINEYADPRGSVLAADQDILMLWDGERSGLVGKGRAGVVSSTMMRLQPLSVVTGSYLYFALSNQFEWIQNRRTGTGVPHVPKDLGRILWIDFPTSRAEQDKISEILSALDSAIERTEALIAKHEKIRAALMQKLFSQGVLPDGGLRPSNEQAPELYQTQVGIIMPVEWARKPLDHIALRGSGHTPNKNLPEFWNGGIKWVSLADSWRLDKIHISETDKEISQLGLNNSSAVLHPPGTVILSRDAGVGKSAIMASEMAVSQHFMAWRCGPSLDRYYLYYYLQNYRHVFENIATGSTIPTIGLRFFKRFMINIPQNIEEQRLIGQILLSADEAIFALERDARKLRALMKGVMVDLLSGRLVAL
jgi:type I restriction enzyme S subunit